MSTTIRYEECPVCEHRPIYEKTRMTTVNVPTANGHETIPYEETYFECPSCHTKFMSNTMMDNNLAAARLKYHTNAAYTNPKPEIISSDLLNKMKYTTPIDITTEISLGYAMTAFFKPRDLVIIRISTTGKTQTKRVNSWRKKSAAEINHILNEQEWM